RRQQGGGCDQGSHQAARAPSTWFGHCIISKGWKKPVGLSREDRSRAPRFLPEGMARAGWRPAPLAWRVAACFPVYSASWAIPAGYSTVRTLAVRKDLRIRG